MCEKYMYSIHLKYKQLFKKWSNSGKANDATIRKY